MKKLILSFLTLIIFSAFNAQKLDYYTKDYFEDIPSNAYNRATSPVLMVQKYYELNEMFGQYWKEPMKKWFEEKFGLPVRSITSY